MITKQFGKIIKLNFNLNSIEIMQTKVFTMNNSEFLQIYLTYVHLSFLGH